MLNTINIENISRNIERQAERARGRDGETEN
jgi:hypothetical protein